MTETIASLEGRFVQGSPFKPITKDKFGNQLVIKTGPNKGQPTQKYYIGLALPKNDPQVTQFLLMNHKATSLAAFPALFQAPNDMPPRFGCQNPNFATKIMDGDGIDNDGKPNNQKPGFAGHWVLGFSSSFVPDVFEVGCYDPMQEIGKDPNRHGLFMLGGRGRIGFTMESNQQDTNPGIYVNLQLVEIVAPCPEAERVLFQTGPNAAQVFGGAPAPGMTGATTPAGQTVQGTPAPNPHTPATGGQIAPASTPGASGVSAPPPNVTPSPSNPPVQPYGGYMNPAGGAAGGGAADPLGAPPGFRMTGQHTYQQLTQAGWTNEMLQAQGMMVPVQ